MSEISPRLKTKGVEAVDKALKLLTLFDKGTSVLTLAELSERSGLVKSSTLRLLVSLQNAGFVAMTRDRRYTIGVEAFRIGRVYQQTFNLEALIRPALLDLVAATGESGSFFRREGSRRICLFREDTDQPLREHVAEGDAVEIGKGAAGHVFLDYEAIDGAAPADEEMLARLPIVSLGERGPGIAGISAPVFGLDEGLVGAISLSGPRTRFTEERIEMMKPLLLRSAAALSHALRSPYYTRLAGRVTG